MRADTRGGFGKIWASVLGAVALVFLLVGNPVSATQIIAPETAVNGAVIPIEIRLDPPLRAGHILKVVVNSSLAAEVFVAEGSVTGFTTRIRGSREVNTIEAYVAAASGGGGRASLHASRTRSGRQPPPLRAKTQVGPSPRPAGGIPAERSAC